MSTGHYYDNPLYLKNVVFASSHTSPYIRPSSHATGRAVDMNLDFSRGGMPAFTKRYRWWVEGPRGGREVYAANESDAIFVYCADHDLPAYSAAFCVASEASSSVEVPKFVVAQSYQVYAAVLAGNGIGHSTLKYRYLTNPRVLMGVRDADVYCGHGYLSHPRWPEIRLALNSMHLKGGQVRFFDPDQIGKDL